MDVAIIGGGLSGLTLALLLQEAGKRVCVLEAQPRPGGRIASVLATGSGEALADLGPTWVWTDYQPVAERWVKRLGLEIFAQYESGLGIYEPVNGAPVTARLPQMYGSMRVAGGTIALVHALTESLAPDVLSTGRTVTNVSVHADDVEIKTTTPDGDGHTTLRATQVVAAVPPRIAAHTIEWSPALESTTGRALAAVPTWMAPHAKAVVLYDRAFWREKGLSGRIASQRGPLVEVHDHCGPQGTPAALFGFVGWPASSRAARGDEALTQAIGEQLSRCFGSDAPSPIAIHVRDWARSPLVATPADLTSNIAHPSRGPDSLRAAHMNGRVRFCVSETASLSPGLIEGAFAAAEETASALLAEPAGT